MIRHGLTFGLLAGVFLLPAPAQAQEPRDEPREIIRRIAYAYGRSPAPDLATLPLVHRLRAAMARADIDGDVVLRDPAKPLEQPSVGWSQRLDDQRARVTLHFVDQGRPAMVEFLFDRASGPWLITEIRNADGRSLRRLLQIPTMP